MSKYQQTLKVTRPDQFANSDFRQEEQPITNSRMQTVFGPFLIDPENAILTRDDELLSLTPKAFAVLCYLVNSAGQLATRDAIFEQVWPRMVVTDGALTVCIREIRNVLGDDPKNACYIETVPKHGYRFICETSCISNNFHNNLQDISLQPTNHLVVGRDIPLRIMQQCQEKALAGTRQLAFVTGEPGIGKTTIVEAFLSQNFQNTNAWVARGQCIEHYGAGEAYLPLLDALGGLAQNHAKELTEILTHYAPTWLQHLPVLDNMLDNPKQHEKSADVHPARMLREITGALEAIAEKRQLVLILEDLHWSDHATIDLLSFLARRDNPVQLLIVGTYRPVDAAVQCHPVKNLKQDLQLRCRCTTIPLEFLNQQHIDTYLSQIFPGHDFPTQFPSIIHQQSDGNPLFMVNLLKYLQNTEFLKNIDGHWQLKENLSTIDRCIPDDLELMINQQVEQLDPECLTLLEAASVASEPGTAAQFTSTEVAAAVGIDEMDAEHCLGRLAQNGHFLHSLGVTEWPDGSFSSCYEFTHALYQNVLYQRVASIRKVRLHKQLGLCLEKGYASRSIEIANKLAVHFEIGRDYFKTVQYLKQAAETAARRGANREAIHTLDKAQELLIKLPVTDEKSHLELSLLLLLAPAITAYKGNATPKIENCYLRARELCEQLDEQSEQFRVLNGLRSFYNIRGDLDKAHQLAQSILELATKLDDSGFLLEAHAGLASNEFFTGNLQASLKHAQQGIALYDKDIHAGHAALYGLDPGVFCYARAGQTIWPLGYPDQALNFEKQAVELAETLDHPYSLVFAILNLTQVLIYRHEGEAALASVKQGKALALQHGFSFLSAWSFHLSAWALALLGDSENARVEIEQALLAERPEAPTTNSYLGVFLAESYHLLGDVQNGLASLAIPCKEYSYEAERLYLQAEFHLLGDNSKKAIDQAEVLFKAALETSRKQQVKAYELRAAISLSKLLMRRKRNQEAHECLDKITRWFQEGFDTPELQEAYQLLEQLDMLLGKDKQNQNVVYLDALVPFSGSLLSKA